MDLYDAGVGDVITIPTHFPPVVTVTGWRGGFGVKPWIWGQMAGDLAQVEWTAGGGWSGYTSLSEATQVELVEKAGPDSPVRRQYEADLEAGLAALASTIGEGEPVGAASRERTGLPARLEVRQDNREGETYV